MALSSNLPGRHSTDRQESLPRRRQFDDQDGFVIAAALTVASAAWQRLLTPKPSAPSSTPVGSGRQRTMPRPSLKQHAVSSTTCSMPLVSAQECASSIWPADPGLSPPQLPTAGGRPSGPRYPPPYVA